MNDSQLWDNFFFACVKYAEDNGGVSNYSTIQNLFTLNDDGFKNITIPVWNHASTKPTNTVLKTYTVSNLANTKNRMNIITQQARLYIPKLSTIDILALGTMSGLMDNVMIYDSTLNKVKFYNASSGLFNIL